MSGVRFRRAGVYHNSRAKSPPPPPVCARVVPAKYIKRSKHASARNVISTKNVIRSWTRGGSCKLNLYSGSSFFLPTPDRAVNPTIATPMLPSSSFSHRGALQIIARGTHSFYTRDDINADDNRATRAAGSIEKWFIIVGASSTVA